MVFHLVFLNLVQFIRGLGHHLAYIYQTPYLKFFQPQNLDPKIHLLKIKYRLLNLMYRYRLHYNLPLSYLYGKFCQSSQLQNSL